MAEQQQPQEQQQQQQQQQKERLKALFPTPPPFYKHFTEHNIAELRRRRKEEGLPPERSSGGGGGVGSVKNEDGRRELDVLALPPDLRFLVPPPPPADAKFQAFGVQHDLNGAPHALADLSIEQLYPDHPGVKLNPQAYLLSMAKSQLTTFLALVGALSRNAEQYEHYTRDLDTITHNMHDLINQYRPHQARETVILMMEGRVEKMRAEIQAIGEARERVTRLMQSLQDGTAGLSGEDMDVDREAERKNGVDADTEVQATATKARQRAAWAALEDAVRADG